MTALVQLDPQLFAARHTGPDFDPAKVDQPPKTNHHSMKPASYLWTSTYTPDKPQMSDWLRLCHDAEHDWPPASMTVIEVALANVYTIDSKHDLDRFMTRAVPIRETDRGRPPETLTDYDVNWTETTKAWGADALRVTEEGHWETRLSRPFSTYSWDCESTAWVNPPTILSHWKLGQRPSTLAVQP